MNPSCTFERYRCDDCQGGNGCGCKRCTMLPHALCLNGSLTSDGFCGMVCQHNYSEVSSLAGLECVNADEMRKEDLAMMPLLLSVVAACASCAVFCVLCARLRGVDFRRRWRYPTPKALSRALNRRCPTSTIASSGRATLLTEDCPICLMQFKPIDQARTLPCASAPSGHTFHSECLDRWLWSTPRCPLCNENCEELLGVQRAPVTAQAVSERNRALVNLANLAGEFGDDLG